MTKFLLLVRVVGEADPRRHIVVVAQARLIQGPARRNAGGADGVRPDGLKVAGWLTNGGSIAPRSSSQRTPPLIVSRSPTDQVSPIQIAQVGRGISIVQSPKFWS